MILIDRPQLEVLSRVLDIVRKDYPDAFIAGGALRDAAQHRAWRDIDVFTWRNIPLDERMDLPQDNTLDSGAAPRVAAVRVPYYYHHADGRQHEVQLIQFAPDRAEPGDIREAVSQFSLGINQIWFDGKEVNYMQVFVKDYDQKLFTITHCESEHEMLRILHKVASLRHKYANELRIPARFHEYLQSIQPSIA